MCQPLQILLPSYLLNHNIHIMVVYEFYEQYRIIGILETWNIHNIRVTFPRIQLQYIRIILMCRIVCELDAKGQCCFVIIGFISSMVTCLFNKLCYPICVTVPCGIHKLFLHLLCPKYIRPFIPLCGCFKLIQDFFVRNKDLAGLIVIAKISKVNKKG